MCDERFAQEYSHFVAHLVLLIKPIAHEAFGFDELKFGVFGEGDMGQSQPEPDASHAPHE